MFRSMLTMCAGLAGLAATACGAGPAKTETAFLGVCTTAIQAALRDQLDLPRGAGVLVERVSKDSPAERAGLQDGDILAKVDDQLVYNQQQLAAYVRNCEPDSAATLTILRRGKQEIVPVTLGRREAAALREPGEGQDLLPPGFPGLPAFPGFPGCGKPPLHDLRGALPALPGAAGCPPLASVSMFNDGTHTISVGGERITVKDRDGKVLHDVPLSDQAGLPQDIRDKIAHMRRLIASPDLDDEDE